MIIIKNKIITNDEEISRWREIVGADGVRVVGADAQQATDDSNIVLTCYNHEDPVEMKISRAELREIGGCLACEYCGTLIYPPLRSRVANALAYGAACEAAEGIIELS